MEKNDTQPKSPLNSADKARSAPEAAVLVPGDELSTLLYQLQEHDLELQAENLALRRSQLKSDAGPQSFNELYDSARFGLVILDTQGKIRNINSAAGALLAASREKLLGKNLFDFTVGTQVERLQEGLEQCRSKGRFSGQLQLDPPDREPVDLQILYSKLDPTSAGGPFQLLLADITPIKRAEGQILRLASFPTLSPNPVLEFSENGKLEWFNAAAQRLAQAVGYQNILDIAPRDSRLLVMECLATGGSRLRQEMVIGDRHILWSFFPVMPNRVVHCYGTDLTERVHLEAQLRQSQHLESVGQLAANVAHDFNNVLTIIHGYTSLLLAQKELSEAMADPLRQISIAAERATNLTRQLTIFSRKNTLQSRELDLNELVQSFGFLLRRVLGENIAQQFNFSPGLPSIEADPGMIEQIIMNLAINARDAMPQGGKLIVETATLNFADEDIHHNPEARPGRFVALSISDTGAGMSSETITKIFDPFFTTKEASTGLGLSAVYGIVKQHNGWIEVSSQLQKGTTFKVFLPVAKTAPTPKTPAPPEPRELTGTETILVVEDEAAVRELSVRELKKLGYNVLEASSGGQAISIWRDHEDEIDLVFTDMVMQDGMTGRDLAETLLAQKPDLKIIYTSGYSIDVVERDFALRKGVNFLQKPYAAGAMAKAIRNLLDA